MWGQILKIFLTFTILAGAGCGRLSSPTLPPGPSPCAFRENFDLRSGSRAVSAPNPKGSASGATTGAVIPAVVAQSALAVSHHADCDHCLQEGEFSGRHARPYGHAKLGTRLGRSGNQPTAAAKPVLTPEPRWTAERTLSRSSTTPTHVQFQIFRI